jgi:hypothetical protein
MKITHSLTSAALVAGILGTIAPVFAAGPNDFFGGSVPAAAQEAAATASSGGDYTDDEKRMQKKYQTSIRHAKGLIAKGDVMMKAGEKKHDDKMMKKGKIIKEIGERRLTELQANNPFPEPEKENKRSKGDTAGGS